MVLSTSSKTGGVTAAGEVGGAKTNSFVAGRTCPECTIMFPKETLRGRHTFGHYRRSSLMATFPKEQTNSMCRQPISDTLLGGDAPLVTTAGALYLLGEGELGARFLRVIPLETLRITAA
eukprot:1185275-Prorocentrum_minimum.AAC.2